MKKKKMSRGQFIGTTLGLSALASAGLKGSPLVRVMESQDRSFEMNEQIRSA